jgi:DNA-binding CsgD family transcriptional regulator
MNATKLFERDRQLGLLDDILRDVQDGSGRLVLVSGEAGIGKTALVRQFTAGHAADAPAYWGACDALFTPRPLGPFIDIAVQIRPGLLGVVQAGPNWHQAATAFLSELNQARSPLILVVEDIHWADEATLDMLKYLGRRIEQTRTLLTLTFRDDEWAAGRLVTPLLADFPARLTLRLPLSPLSQDAVEQMAQRARRDAAGIFAATGGNPFFVSELLAGEPGAVPASVRDLVLGRIAQLSPAARDCAELIALIPGGAELPLLESIFPGPAPATDECVERGVLAAGAERLAFPHELARRAVADSLAPGRARRFHALILQALLVDGAPGGAPAGARAESLPQLVHHAALAGDFAALLRYAPVAARQASLLGAHREAAAHYQLVLSRLLTLPPETRAELLEGRSFECYLTGEIATAFQVRRQALLLWHSLHNRLREGDNLRWLSRLAWFSGKRGEAEQLAQAAVETLEQLPPGPELAMAYSNKAQLHMLAEEPAPARSWGARAIALAEQLAAVEILVHALITVGTAELMAGVEAGWDHVAQALALARDRELHDDAGRAYANLSSMAVRLHRYAPAAAWLAEALAYTDEHELDSYRVYLLGWRARLHLETGRWPEAEADATQALRQQAGASVIPLPALIVLGHLQARRGEPEAAAWLAKAAVQAAPTRELQRLGPLAAACAEHAWWRGRPAEVPEAVRPAYDLALEHLASGAGDPWVLGALAYWLWRAGAKYVPVEGLAEPCRLMIAGDWAAAAAAWAALGCPFEQALALSAGSPSAQLEALRIFEALGARPAAAMLKSELRGHGVKGLPRGPRPVTRDNPAGLTDRELEVLALLAQGLSNAAIAAHLSLSKKTVDHHVSAILGKLSAATRAEAIAIAHRERLLT